MEEYKNAPPMTIVFWGDTARSCGVVCYEDAETALRSVVAGMSNADALQALAVRSLNSKLRAVESDGLFDVHENVGTDAAPRWELKLLGIEPDGLVQSLAPELSFSQCLQLLEPTVELARLAIDPRTHTVRPWGWGEVLSGMILVRRDDVLEASGCTVEDWRKVARKGLDREIRLCSSYLGRPG